MANRIIQGILVKGKKHFSERRYIGKVRAVEIEKVSIFVQLSSEDFFKIKTCMDDDPDTEQQFVEEEEASSWIQRCVVGGITK